MLNRITRTSIGVSLVIGIPVLLWVFLSVRPDIWTLAPSALIGGSLISRRLRKSGDLVPTWLWYSISIPFWSAELYGAMSFACCGYGVFYLPNARMDLAERIVCGLVGYPVGMMTMFPMAAIGASISGGIAVAVRVLMAGISRFLLRSGERPRQVQMFGRIRPR